MENMFITICSAYRTTDRTWPHSSSIIPEPWFGCWRCATWTSRWRCGTWTRSAPTWSGCGSCSAVWWTARGPSARAGSSPRRSVVVFSIEYWLIKPYFGKAVENAFLQICWGVDEKYEFSEKLSVNSHLKIMRKCFIKKGSARYFYGFLN